MRNCAVCNSPGHHRWEADNQRYRCNLCRNKPEPEFIEAVEFIGGAVPEDMNTGEWFVYLSMLTSKKLKLPTRMVYKMMTPDQRKIIMTEYHLLTSI